MTIAMLTIAALCLCYCVGIVSYWTEKDFRDFVDQQDEHKRLILLLAGLIKSVMMILYLFTVMSGVIVTAYVIKLIGG